MFYIKCFTLSFLCFSSLADNTPSFSFSEEEGLKPLQESSALSEKDSKAESLKKETISSENISTKKLKNTDKQVNQTKIETSESLKTDITNSETSIQTEYKADTPNNNLSEKKSIGDSPEDSFVNSLTKEDINPEDKKATRDSISETFAPEKEKNSLIDGSDSFFKDVSWIFQKKQTKHKLAVVPIYSYDKTESSRFGFRLFSFSPEEKGYYFALSGAKYWPKNYYSSSLNYKSKRNGVFRSELSFIYDDHYELYYGSLRKFEGMEASLDEVQKLESHRLILDYNLFYQEKEKPFYFGAGSQSLFQTREKIFTR